jgi:hypothetical protein
MPEENKPRQSNNQFKWLIKAISYFISINILLFLFYIPIFGGARSIGSIILRLTVNKLYIFAIPVASLSLGIALRGINQSPARQKFSKVLVLFGFGLIMLVLLLDIFISY